MTKAQYFTLDVFTSQHFGGNPLAVFPNGEDVPESLYQKIANELNLSETVFLFPKKGEVIPMRIFTPKKELPTAGHPTIGTAYLLAHLAHIKGQNLAKLTFEQKIGKIPVTVDLRADGPGLITMSQPLPTFGPTHDDKKDKLADILGLSITDLTDAPIQEVSCGNNCLFIPILDTSSLARICVNTGKWVKLKPEVNHAFLYPYTLSGVQDGGVQGRMFAPEVGIAEDPATGSANGPLACYLTHHGLLAMPAKSLQGYEMGRPSQLHLDTTIHSDGTITKVTVGGHSLLTGEGYHFIH